MSDSLFCVKYWLSEFRKSHWTINQSLQTTAIVCVGVERRGHHCHKGQLVLQCGTSRVTDA